MSIDVDEWITRVQRLSSFDPTSATIDVLDTIAPDVNAVGGWIASLRAQCAARRAQLANDAATAGRPLPDHGDPEGGHSTKNKQSRRTSAKDAERDTTMTLLPALRSALTAGDLGVDHIDIVTAVLRDFTEAQRVMITGHGTRIAELAVANTTDRFRIALRRLLLRLIDEDGIRRFERQRRNTRLGVWVNQDTGMVHISGQFDPERGLVIANLLQTALDAQFALPVPHGCPDDPQAKNDYLRAMALIQLLRSGSGGTEGGGGPDDVQIDMGVMIDLDTLRYGLHEHSIIDTGLPVDLPVETLRRMACCANIIPMVLGSDGVVLDQGRENRLANRRQRRALRAMYPTCAIAGCHTKFDHCKIHHIQWWERDHGPTDLANLLPLCSKHHHLAHEGGWLLALHPTTRILTVTFPDGTSTDMPPPRKGWTAGRASPGDAARDRVPRPAHDGGPARTAGTDQMTGPSRPSASPAPPGHPPGRPPGPSLDAESDSGVDPQLQLWAS